MSSGSSTLYCFRAWPIPATLPCPKIPNMPAMVRSRCSPSTVHWWPKNSTSAWLTVIFFVAAMCLAFLLFIGQTGIKFLSVPGLAYPRMRWVIIDQPNTFWVGTSHDVEVVQVIAGGCHRGAVVAVWNQRDISGVDHGVDINIRSEEHTSELQS